MEEPPGEETNVPGGAPPCVDSAAKPMARVCMLYGAAALSDNQGISQKRNCKEKISARQFGGQEGELDAEGCAVAGSADDLDLPAVGLNDVLDD